MSAASDFHGVDIDRVHRGGRPKGSFVDGSLQNRIRQFFAANPGEELSYADMAVKFDCTLGSARNAVRELRDLGELESLHLIRAKAKAAA